MARHLLGAGAKTHLESSMNKCKPHLHHGCSFFQAEDGQDSSPCGDKRSAHKLVAGAMLLYTGTGVVTQVQVGYANSLHLRTRSAAQLDEAAALGVSIPYRTYLQMMTTMANDEVKRAEATASGDTFVPSNILRVADNPGVGRVLRCAIDNQDYGDGTSFTQLCVYQSQKATQVHPPRPKMPIGKVRSFRHPPGVHDLVPMSRMPSKEGPAIGACDSLYEHAVVAVEQQQGTYAEVTMAHASTVGMFVYPTAPARGHRTWRPAPAARRDELQDKELLFNLCGVQGPSMDWTGWNQTYSLSNAGLCDRVDVVGQCPPFDGVAHQESVQHTLVDRMRRIRDEVSPGTPFVVTADQDVYRGLCALKAAMPDEYADVTLRMGTLHILIHWMKVVCAKYLEDSGLVDILAETDYYGAGQAESVGKAGNSMYNRCFKAQKQLSQSVFQVVWPEFSEWCLAEDKLTRADLDKLLVAVDELNAALADTVGVDPANVGPEVAAKLDAAFVLLVDSSLGRRMKEWAGTLPPTQRYWVVAADMCRLGLQLIRADRERDWPLHVSTVEAMLPFFHGYGKVKYARYVVHYLADMKNLERDAPEVHTAFMAGEFVVATSPVPFTAIDSDQALEHTNGAAKGTGGVAGKHVIVDSQNTLQRHTLTLHKRMQLNLDWQHLFGKRRWYDEVGLDEAENPFAKYADRHPDCRQARITRHAEVVKQLRDIFRGFHLHEATDDNLINIVCSHENQNKEFNTVNS